MRRSALATAFLLLPLPLAAQEGPAWGHEEWSALEPPAREAFVRGFLIGAAWSEAGGFRIGPDAIAEAVRLREEERLRFAFAPNVYLVRLADHYFWENHRGQRLARALLEVDRSLSAAGRGESPVRRGAGARDPEDAAGEAPPGGDAAGADPGGRRPEGAGTLPGPEDPLGLDGRHYAAWRRPAREAFAAGLAAGAAASAALRGDGDLEEGMDRLAGGRGACVSVPCPAGGCVRVLDAYYGSGARLDVPVLRALSEMTCGR